MKWLSLIPALLLTLLAAPLLATDTAPIAGAVERLNGQEATFTQRFLPRGYKKEQVETGQVVFGAAPASRWSYESPESKTFVFDGVTSWMYVPADESVMVHRVTSEEKKRLPFFVLSDPARLETWYRVTRKGDTFELEAKTDDALLKTISLALDSSGMIETLTYVDSQGNRTAFDLQGWKPRASTSEMFTFVPPAGVDVIEN